MKYILSLVFSLFIVFNASANEDDLSISEQEAKDITSLTPLFAKRIGRVSFDKGNICLTCGNFADDYGQGGSHVQELMDHKFITFLKDQIYQSNIFQKDVKDRIQLRATLTDLKQESSVGASMEHKYRVTSGATLTTQVSIRYELLDSEQISGAWNITTRAQSNSISQRARITEAIDVALERNVRALILNFIADYSPSESNRAKQLLTSLDGETDNTRSVIGYLIYGVGKVGVTTANAAGSVLSSMAEACQSDPSCANGEGLRRSQASLNETIANSNRTSSEMVSRGMQQRQNQIKASQQESNNNQSQRNEQIRQNNLRVAQLDQHTNQQGQAQQHEPAQQNKQTSQPEQLQQAEQARKQKQANLQEQAQQQKLARQQEEAKKKADAETAKLADEKAQKQAEKQYLSAMASGTRLGVKNCYGSYEVGGKIPNIKPAVVSCIDVYYRARCDGNPTNYDGVIKNFIGFDVGCFGDTVSIEPKPACPVAKVRVEVKEVRGCGG